MADIAARPSEESINSLSLFLSRGTLFGFVKPPSSSLFSSFLGNVLKTAAKQRDDALYTACSRCHEESFSIKGLRIRVHKALNGLVLKN